MPEEFIRKEHLLKVGFSTRFKRLRLKNNCEHCGNEYERIKSDLGRFCGYICSNRARGKEMGERRKGHKYIRYLNCKICNKNFWDYRSRKNRIYCSKLCKNISTRKPPELKRDKTKLRQWSKKILERDNFKCVICKNQNIKILQAAHIKSREFYPELQYDLKNGRTLCIQCHAEESPNRLKNFILAFDKIGRNPIISICKYCGNRYQRKPSHGGKFCSHKCYANSLREYHRNRIKKYESTISAMCQ